MNRRSLLALFGLAPAAAVATKLAVPAAAEVWQPPVTVTIKYPVGYMIDAVTHVVDPGHNHSFNDNFRAVAIVKKQIFDGERFVDYDSPAGTVVWNKLIGAWQNG